MSKERELEKQKIKEKEDQVVFLKRASNSFYDANGSPLGKYIGINKTSNLNSADSKNNEFSFLDNAEFSFPNTIENNNGKNSNNISIINDTEGIKLENVKVNSTNLTYEIMHDKKLKKIQIIEKLKDEYNNLVEEKKNLQAKVSDLTDKCQKSKDLNEKNISLYLQLDITNEKIKVLNEENKTLQERNSKITRENFETTNTNNQLKESLKYLEKERILNKNKINSNFNRVKIYEKENNAYKKKLNNLNINLKNLTEKLNHSNQEKILMQKNLDDVKQEYENKITNLLLEQQKIIKDSFLTTLQSLEEKKIPLEFIYNEEKNSLCIMLEDIIITEFTDLNLKITKLEKLDGNNNKDINANFAKSHLQDDHCSNMRASLNQDSSMVMNSPSNKNNLMNVDIKNIFNNDYTKLNSRSTTKNRYVDLETILSLNKILSGSSKKSFSQTNHKTDHPSDFFSAKKTTAFYEENYPYINNFAGYYNNVNETNDLYNNNPFNNFSLKNQNLIPFPSNNKNFQDMLVCSNIKPNENKQNNLNEAFIDSSVYSNNTKLLNLTIKNNYENDNSCYKNERYSALGTSAKKKCKVSNFSINNRFVLNDENANPNIGDTHLVTINKFSAEKEPNVNYSRLTNHFNNTNNKNNENSYPNNKRPSCEENKWQETQSCNSNNFKKINNGSKNYSGLGSIKAFNSNNNFEKCLKNININTDQINNFNRDDIKNFISTASTTRHRRMISLDEALNMDEIQEKEICVTEKNANCLYETNIPDINDKDNNVFNKNSIGRKHFSFDRQTLNIYESTKAIKRNHDNLIIQKMEFQTDENDELNKIKNGKVENSIQNIVNSFSLLPSLKQKEKIYLIDSNVNLITIDSYKKPNNKNIVSSESQIFFNAQSNIKQQKFNNLILSYNDDLKIEQQIKLDEGKITNGKSYSIVISGEKRLQILSEENFDVNKAKEINYENTLKTENSPYEDMKKNNFRNVEKMNL